MSTEFETGAFSNTPAWHKAGTVVQGFMSTKDAFIKSGLDWLGGVEKRPIFTTKEKPQPNSQPEDLVQASSLPYSPDAAYYKRILPNPIIIPDKFAVVRNMDNNVLGVVGPDYQVIQNIEMFNFLDALTIGENKVAQWESAGSLRGGKSVWALLNLVESEIIVGKNDRILPYLLVTNAHDGSAACRVIPTTVRVVCWNTLSAAVAGQFRDLVVTIRHTGDTEAKLEEAKLILAQAGEMFGAFGKVANELRETAVTKDALEQLVESLFPTPDVGDSKAMITRTKNNRNLLANSIKEEVLLLGPGNPLDYWTLLNGVTRFADHAKQVNAGKRNKDEARFESNMIGSGNKFKQHATKVLIELSKN